MTEAKVSKYEFYQEFAQNRERSALGRVLPFVLTFTVELPPGIIIAANPYVAAEVIAEHPELSIALALATTSLAGTGILALIQSLDITRANSTNGRIAQHIGQLEGRDPKTSAEINNEIEHVKQIVRVASRISPTPSHLFDLAFNHNLARFRIRKHPEVLEEQAISDRRMRKWSLRSIEMGEIGYPVDPQRVTDALLLAERRWASLIEDDRKPEYIRRYGALMKGEIQSKLAEHLTSPAWGEFERKRALFQSMSPAELAQELKWLIGNFPESSFLSIYDDKLDDREWERRNESPEKKRLFEQIRNLVSRSSGTRGSQEVLLRELSFLYNRGLDREEMSFLTVNSPLLNAIGLGENGGSIFDPERCQEIEQRFYKFIWDKDKVEWSPLYHDSFSESNPIKRWLLNRREEGWEVIGIVSNKLLPTPALEQSWKRQYKAKYKKTLKP